MMYQPINPAPDPNAKQRSEGGSAHGSRDDFSGLTRFLRLLPEFSIEDFKALSFDPGRAVVDYLRGNFPRMSRQQRVGESDAELPPTARELLAGGIDALRLPGGASGPVIPKELAQAITAAEARERWSLLQACVDSGELLLFEHALEAGYPATWRPAYHPPLARDKKLRSTGTLLHYAALRASPDHVLALHTAAGMPLDERDSRGDTALSLVGKAMLARVSGFNSADSATAVAALATLHPLAETALKLLRLKADPGAAPRRAESFTYSYLAWLSSTKNRFPMQEQVGKRLALRVGDAGPNRGRTIFNSPFVQCRSYAEELGTKGKFGPIGAKTPTDLAQSGLFNELLRTGASIRLIADVMRAVLSARGYQHLPRANRPEVAVLLAGHMHEIMYELPQSVSIYLAKNFDSDLYQQLRNPYEAELLALASHPTGNSDGNFAKNLTLAITATYDFHNNGIKKGTWEHLRQWQQIGARNFQHILLKLDSMGTIPCEGGHTSMLELYGFRPVEAGRLGNGFALKTGEDEYVEFLRGGFLGIKRGVGALFIRNSSPSFDMRQLLESPAYISKGDYWDSVEKQTGRHAIGSFVLQRPKDFAHILEFKMYFSGHFLKRLAKLNHTIASGLRRYHQWKCVTAHDALWSAEKKDTLAPASLYRSPGFSAVSRFIRGWRGEERGALDLAWHDPHRPAFALVPYVDHDGRDKYRLRVDAAVAHGIYRLAANPAGFPWSEYRQLRSFFQGGINSHGNLTLLNGTV